MAKKKGYKVILVGIGMIGSEMIKVLVQRKFPASEIKILARSTRKQKIRGRTYQVVKADIDEFDGYDIAFFAGTEGASGASKVYGWEAVKRGVVVIDNGKDFRYDKRVPLVVPEVNADALKKHKGFVSNPNCSTIQMVTALAPIHRAVGIKRIVVSTYQAVSGTGGGAVDEMREQLTQVGAGKKTKPKVYPVQIVGNLIPQISSLDPEFPGYFEEETKMVKETRKIFGDNRIQVSATCVRVPVFNGHSESVNIQTRQKITPGEVRKLLRRAKGVTVVDDAKKGVWPYPLMADGNDDVYVGRIREDTSAKNAIDLFCVGDNIRKGGSLNAVQIAETMIKMKLI